jgi:hypothetical protein
MARLTFPSFVVVLETSREVAKYLLGILKATYNSRHWCIHTGESFGICLGPVQISVSERWSLEVGPPEKS